MQFLVQNSVVKDTHRANPAEQEAAKKELQGNTESLNSFQIQNHC